MFPSRDPGAAIQAAVFATLTTHPATVAVFAALAANAGPPRVYDAPPASPDGQSTAKFPYYTIGEDQLIGETNQGSDDTEAWVQVQTWSRATSYGEAKLLAGAVRDALSQYLDLAGHRTITFAFHNSLPRKEPDGLTRRIISTFRYQTQPGFPTGSFGPIP